jgi:ribonuclease HII
LQGAFFSEDGLWVRLPTPVARHKTQAKPEQNTNLSSHTHDNVHVILQYIFITPTHTKPTMIRSFVKAVRLIQWQAVQCTRQSESRAFVMMVPTSSPSNIQVHGTLNQHMCTNRTRSISTATSQQKYSYRNTPRFARHLCASSSESRTQQAGSLVAGLETVGRGAVVGPMASSIVVLDPKSHSYNTVSKQLQALSRPQQVKNTQLEEDVDSVEAIASMIKQQALFCSTVFVSGETIDNVRSKTFEAKSSSTGCHHQSSIDADCDIELSSMVELIRMMCNSRPVCLPEGLHSHLQQVVVSCAEEESDPIRLGDMLLAKYDKPLLCELVYEYQAYRNHVAVAAARIVARAERDAAMRSIAYHLQMNTIGSGYLDDADTHAFVDQYYDDLVLSSYPMRDSRARERVANQRPFVCHSRCTELGDKSAALPLFVTPVSSWLGESGDA